MSGLRQCRHGLKATSDRAYLEQSAAAIDAQVDSANTAMLTAKPLYVSVVTDLNKLGLLTARLRDSADAHKARALYGRAAAHYGRASQLSADMQAHESLNATKPFWATLTTVFADYGRAASLDEQITVMFTDESRRDANAFVDSALTLSHCRDSLKLVAYNARARADGVFIVSKGRKS